MARRKVNMWGMNGLGAVSGLHPAVGAAVSVGLGTGTAIAVRQFKPEYDKWSELIGGGVGLLAGAAMMISPKSRGAGVTGIVATVLNNGLRFAESMITKKPAMVANTAGYGIVTPEVVPTLGAVAAYQVPTLGATAAYQVPTLGGDVQVEPRQLAGNLPVFEGSLGRHYGATIMG